MTLRNTFCVTNPGNLAMTQQTASLLQKPEDIEKLYLHVLQSDILPRYSQRNNTMSSVNIRLRPKMTAIPRPIQANHKSRQYHQLKTTEPKVNWSAYKVLPSIGTTELDEFIKNENDSYDKEPTRYDDISDSEFLYDQMTAESDEMIKREAAIRIIRETAFVQFLELKSDYMGWVIRMAHKNIWIPVKFEELPRTVSIPQSPVTDDPGKYEPSSPTYSNGIPQGRDDPEVLTPKPSSCDKDQSTFHVNTNTVMPKPPAYPKDQTANNVNRNFFLPKPPAIPKCLSTTIRRKENIVPKSPCYSKDELQGKLIAISSEAMPAPSNKDPLSNNVSHENRVPKPPAQSQDQQTTVIGTRKFLPKPPVYPKDKSFRTANPDAFVPMPPAYPDKQCHINSSPDLKMRLPSRPDNTQDSDRNNRKILRPDRVTELTHLSSNLNHIPESPINLALI